MKTTSPCIFVCKLDRTNSYCVGCRRTVVEISHWLFLSDLEKTKINEDIERRKAEQERVE